MKIQTQRETFAYRLAAFGDGYRASPTPDGLPLLGDELPTLTDEESQALYDQNTQADVMGKLDQEFNDWAWENKKENPYDTPDSPGWHGEPRGAIGYWPHVEDFLKEKYPAAHRGLTLGMEEVGYLMDLVPHDAGWGRRRSDGQGEVDDMPPYETGVEAVEKYGYDPKEIVANLMLLHSQTSPRRRDKQNIIQEDLERLHDIAVRRFRVQRQYEEQHGRRSPREAPFSPREVGA